MPSPASSLGRFGSRAPTEIDVITPGMERDLLRVPIVSATGKGTAGTAQKGAVDPRMRELRENAGELHTGSKKAHDRGALRTD